MAYHVGVYPRVDSVIASIEATHSWDIAQTTEAAYMYQLRAAQNINIYPPFSDEHQLLNCYLMARMAGLRLCDYAWRLFAQSID